MAVARFSRAVTCRRVVLLVAGGLAASSPARVAGQAVTERVSVSTAGEQGANASQRPTISDGGRFVAFESLAGNLVPADGNEDWDIFVRDRLEGLTERVSVSSAGTEGDDWSQDAVISSDGRFVAFASNASNLVPDDTNGASDVFLRDRLAGATERISVGSTGIQGNQGNRNPVISADGRFVAFASLADNLVPGDTNGSWDVFVRDRQSGTTERVSLTSTGVEANDDCEHPGISDDGRYVVFDSLSTNLVPGDTNHCRDIFLHDRLTGSTERISLSWIGEQSNNGCGYPVISGDGLVAAFESLASNLVPDDSNGDVDVFVVDLLSLAVELASVSTAGIQGGSTSAGPDLDGDGHRLVFDSRAQNLVPGDSNGHQDVFLRDRNAARTDFASLGPDGVQGNDHAVQGVISADGRWIAWMSASTNLVPGDTNATPDVFVRGPFLDEIFDDGFETGDTTRWTLGRSQGW